MRRPFLNDVHFNEPGADPDLPEVDGYRPRIVTATAYTLVAADDCRILMFACAQDTIVTVPTDLAPPASNTRLDIMIERGGPGTLTLSVDAGVAIDADTEAAMPLRLAAPDSGAALSRVGPNRWRITGDFVRSDD